MKKFYISLSLVTSMFIANKGIAQITLTSAYLPQVGYTYNMVVDTTTAEMPTFTVSAGSASAQVWDYSAGFSSVYSAATSFVAPGSNPGASSFPNSNLASDQGGGNWGYLISGTTGLFVDGAYVSAQGVTAALDFNPNAPQLPTPFAYGNTTTVTYTAIGNTTYGGILPVVINHHAVRTVTADAFGSLTTPTGTYSNTLRVMTYEVSHDSISVTGNNPINRYDTTTNYSWYQNSLDALVMSIDQNTAGAATKAQYLQTFSNAINTIKHSELATNLYPNPASTLSFLSYENVTSSKVSANIFDLTGKQVAAILNNQQQAAGKQTLTIDVNNLQLAQGLYMVQLTVNGTTKTLKLNVQ